ncbi:MAG: DUF6051 family protein, partial [Spirochaetaceae bacterium]
MIRSTTRNSYHHLFSKLGEVFDINRPEIDLRDSGIPVRVRSFRFTSAQDIHPDSDFGRQGSTFRALVSFFLENNPFSRRNFLRELESPDRDVVENRDFRYAVFLPVLPPADKATSPACDRPALFDRAILLLHGLNEKAWQKYLPWAARLTELTGRPVILFPIAFHMNRAPEAWANPREMMGVARERKRLFPNLEAGSFANAALSHRIQFAPHRFLVSGLETYLNLLDLVRQVRSGTHSCFNPGSGVDFFGYSIGASLTELLMMANRGGLFSDSRAFLFCGGSILDQANPVSRAIMDEEAYRTLVGFLRAFAADPSSALPVGHEKLQTLEREIDIVRSMLFRERLASTREWIMRSIGGRVSAVVLRKDGVFHPEGMLRSWAGDDEGPLVEITVADPDYDYSHEQPFPDRAA